MNNTSIFIAKFLKYALWGCLYLILITPLLLSSKFLFPFITLKAIYFRLAVELALFLYLALALMDSYYRPKMNKLIWLVLGFGLIVGITAMLGVNPYKSFWGNIERGEGFLTISHLIIFFFILSQMIRTKAEMLNYLTGSVAVSLLVSGYALAQRLGADWTIHAGEGRLSATLGNAAYMGAYTLGHIWFCLILLVSKKQLWWKILFSTIGLFLIYIMFQTQTRGAVLGGLISLFLLGLVLIWLSRNKKVKIFIGLALLFLTLSAGFIRLSQDEPWVQNSVALNRLAAISFADITVESRLYAWDSSWKGWRDRFLIGYGWENYNSAFDRYFHPEIYRDQGSQIWFDRAHNTVFDVAVATGLIGLIIYLSIFITALIFLIIHIKRNRDNLYLSLLLASFLLAHFLQNIFVFDCLATYIMLFTLFACVAFIKNEPAISPDHQIKPLNLYVLIPAALLMAAAMYNFNLKPAQANQIGIKALQAMYQGNINQGIDIFHQAINLNTYQSPELRQKFAENILFNNNTSRGLSEDQIKANYAKAIDQIKTNIDNYPAETQNYLYLMALLNAAYKYNPNYLNQVLYYGETAKKMSPTRQQIYFEMGRAKIVMGQTEDGIKDFQRAVELNPKTRESHWNLITAYILTKHIEEARAHYADYLESGESADDLERLSRLYGSVNQNQPLVDIYQKLIKREPDNVKHWTGLAAVYKALGDIDQARAITLRVLEISDDPKAIEEAEKFLEELK